MGSVRNDADALATVDVGPLMGQSIDPSDFRVTVTANDISRACRSIGFLKVTNTGLGSLQKRALNYAKAYFALEKQEKMKLFIGKSTLHRGYFPVKEEFLNTNGDLKEGMDIGRELSHTHPFVIEGKPLHGSNQWPDENEHPQLRGFRDTMLAYFDGVEHLARRVLMAFAIAFGIRHDFFEDCTQEPMDALRLLHYPPQEPSTVADGELGCGAHTDYGCVTILGTDVNGGLQVRRNNRWVDVSPPPLGTFVVNVGDMMARWTGDYFPSTLHRVVNISGRDRYSIPFFFNPDFDTVVSTLETPKLSNATLKAYPPVQMGEHLTKRFNATFKYAQANELDQDR